MFKRRFISAEFSLKRFPVEYFSSLVFTILNRNVTQFHFSSINHESSLRNDRNNKYSSCCVAWLAYVLYIWNIPTMQDDVAISNFQHITIYRNDARWIINRWNIIILTRSDIRSNQFFFCVLIFPQIYVFFEYFWIVSHNEWHS